MLELRPLALQSAVDLEPLLSVSRDEGYTFVQRLWDEYERGQERFDGPGALLLGGFGSGGLVAVGGVCRDRYLQDPAIGRIQHVYVLPDQRRAGSGAQLVRALIDHAGRHFTTLTLRTLTDQGAAFYQALGFSAEARYDQATHWLDLTP